MVGGMIGAVVRGVVLGAGLLTGSHPAASCAYPMLSLQQIAQRAPDAVVADVTRERPDATGGYTSTLRIRGVIKGRSPGPALALTGLGLLDETCSGGPRLRTGGRYVLFLTSGGSGQNANWFLYDFDGGVYQLASGETWYPPDEPGGEPQSQQVPAAELIRRVGAYAHTDPDRIQSLIDSLNLPEAFDAQPLHPTSRHSRIPGWIPRSFPSRAQSLSVAAVAIMLAGLVYLVWRVPPQRSGRV